MNRSTNFKELVINLISYAFILLMMYTATSKIIDFENFKIQISQSMVISPFTNELVWFIPLVEVMIAVGLMVNKWRTLAFHAAFVLMVIFSTYIYIILNFIPDIPCSCGGVLEKMSWEEHLIFNLAFVILALIAVLTEKCNLKRIGTISLLTIFGTASVLFLYQNASDRLQKENPFIRVFHSKWVNYEKEVDLRVNSYYFAGWDKNQLYLANYTAPTHLLQIDTTFSQKKEITITLHSDSIPIKKPIIKVNPPNFYWMDGAIPFMMNGSFLDWKTKTVNKDIPFFTQIERLSDNEFIIRTNKANNGENTIGTFNVNNPFLFKANHNLLEKQNNNDGIFETEGSLFHDPISNLTGYVYRYKNGFVVTDYQVKEINRGKTIDTFYQPNIKIHKNNNGQKLETLPTIVNNKVAAYNNLLFINSPLRGQFDNLNAWQNNATIDVYNLQTMDYLFSFYITLYRGQKLNSFIVTDEKIYALVGNKMVKYAFNMPIKFKKKQINKNIPAGSRGTIENLKKRVDQ